MRFSRVEKSAFEIANEAEKKRIQLAKRQKLLTLEGLGNKIAQISTAAPPGYIVSYLGTSHGECMWRNLLCSGQETLFHNVSSI